MNILVLGGSGFVGRRVVQGLREYGHQVSTPSHWELDLLNVSADAAQRCYPSVAQRLHQVSLPFFYRSQPAHEPLPAVEVRHLGGGAADCHPLHTAQFFWRGTGGAGFFGQGHG